MWIDDESFAQVIRCTPLVAIDLIVRDERGAVLVGRRQNEPARGYWFVPGGRIRKDELLDQAFARLARQELGLVARRRDAALLGVYEHIYAENCLGRNGFGTHYVVVAHELRAGRGSLSLPTDQHSEFRWVDLAQLRDDASIHPNCRAYHPALEPCRTTIAGA